MPIRPVSRLALTLVVALAAPVAVHGDGGAQHQAAQSLPIRLGTSGGNVKDTSKAFCCSGTLGALVARGGIRYVLSNNHVLGRGGAAAPGEDVSQPGLIDSGCRARTIVADFSDAAPLGPSNVDAALAEVRPGAVDPAGEILDVGVPASTTDIPAVGMLVAKSGRTTGLTCASITSVLTDVSVQYQRGCNSGKKFTVTYLDQVVVGSGSFSAGGDSGSLIVAADSARPVALLFAGSSTTTIGNPIQDVIAALGVSVVGGATHAVACPGSAVATSGSTALAPAGDALARAAGVKSAHAQRLLSRPGVQGVGVGAAADDPSELALVVYVVQGMGHDPLPEVLDGMPVRVERSERFQAFGWNERDGLSCAAH